LKLNIKPDLFYTYHLYRYYLFEPKLSGYRVISSEIIYWTENPYTTFHSFKTFNIRDTRWANHTMTHCLSYWLYSPFFFPILFLTSFLWQQKILSLDSGWVIHYTPGNLFVHWILGTVPKSQVGLGKIFFFRENHCSPWKKLWQI
jgi:hypothetical protein